MSEHIRELAVQILQEHQTAIHFLMSQIEKMVNEGEEFDFEEAKPILDAVGVSLGEDYFCN